MKKVRIVLTIAAFVVAIGGTLATQYESPSLIEGFEYIPASAGVPAQCVSREVECDTESANLCTWISGNKVGDNNSVSTQCGMQLRRP